VPHKDDSLVIVLAVAGGATLVGLVYVLCRRHRLSRGRQVLLNDDALLLEG
jgi:hypothetical protein